MKPYKVAANLEWTSKCNARCVMCPQSSIEHPKLITRDIFDAAMKRINGEDLFRVVIAGYGEPTTHPLFMDFIEEVGKHPVRFDLVTNGQELNEKRLQHIDGKIDLMVISFSSIDPNVYERVHVNLDHERVKNNIVVAQKTFRKTQLGISLTPLAECLDTLPETIRWLRSNGIHLLTMSPTLYDRGGKMIDQKLSTERLRKTISEFELHSQEMDFVHSLSNSLRQLWNNKFICMPRNSDIFITSSGEYLYCYNDISHKNTLGHVNELSIREALTLREKMGPIDSICSNCNMLQRYGPSELFKVAGKHLADKYHQIASGG